MKEDNISQLGNYEAPFCEQQYTHGSWYISLFKFKSFEQFNTPPPQTVPNFRHLLSCGTIGSLYMSPGWMSSRGSLLIAVKSKFCEHKPGLPLLTTI